MKTFGSLISLLLFALPLSSFAAWQVAKPEAAAPRDPFFQAGTQLKEFSAANSPVKGPFPNQISATTIGKPSAVYAISISGSLKENIERIMGRYHWRVVWKAPYDYNFDGRITGSSLPNVMEKLLQPFPLQAVMYMSNRTLAIVPRYRT